MAATDRIRVSAQAHTMNVFSGHIPDESTGDELLTRTAVKTVTFQRYLIRPAMTGVGAVEILLDTEEVAIPETEYELYDVLQSGLPQSTSGVPYTWIWLIPEKREPFFPDKGKYYVEFRFYPRDAGTTLKMTFEVTVS